MIAVDGRGIEAADTAVVGVTTGRADVRRPASNPFKGLAKRVVERLIRFHTVRQATTDAELAARIDALEQAQAAIAELRRDLHDAALEQRRVLAETRQQIAAVSARLTFVQRERDPARSRLDELAGRVDALCDRFERLTGP